VAADCRRYEEQPRVEATISRHSNPAGGVTVAADCRRYEEQSHVAATISRHGNPTQGDEWRQIAAAMENTPM